MKKVYKIFKLVGGYHGEKHAYYEATPMQLEDVTFSVSEKHEYKSEASALKDLEKSEEYELNNGEFLILPVYKR